MSRSDGTATRIPCPTPDCPGLLQLDQREDPTVVKCRRCGFTEDAVAFARQAAGGAR